MDNPRTFRRVVTGNDQNGKSRVLFDGPAPNVQNRGGRAAGQTPIHRTRSVDCGVVQLGDYHQWVTMGAPCVMSYVMIGGEFPD